MQTLWKWAQICIENEFMFKATQKCGTNVEGELRDDSKILKSANHRKRKGASNSNSQVRKNLR